MKKSMLLLNYKASNGKTYYLHTGNGNMISVDNTLDFKLKEVLEKNVNCQEDEYFTQLITILRNMEFLIEDNINEFQIEIGKKVFEMQERNILELIILPTENCNFRCVYCYETFSKPAMSFETQENIVNFVRNELKKKAGLSVGWFGGEPLLALDVIKNLSEKFISICREYKKPYRSAITTNGYFLNYETFKKLLKLKVTFFQITIDGSEDIHNKQRPCGNGKPSFETIMKNLKEIQERSISGLWNIVLRTNVTKQIIQDLNYKQNVIEPFVNDIRFQFMLRKMWTNNTEAADKIWCSDIEFERFIDQCEIPPQSLDNEYKYSYKGSFTCYAANSNALVIGSDGKLYKCTVALYDDINQIGYITEGGKKILDQNKLAYWLAPWMKSYEKCQSCGALGACVMQSCPYKQYTSCAGDRLNMVKPYFPKFSEIAEKYIDVSELLKKLCEGRLKIMSVREKINMILEQNGVDCDNKVELEEMDSLTYISCIVDIEETFNIELPDTLLEKNWLEDLNEFAQFIEMFIAQRT